MSERFNEEEIQAAKEYLEEKGPTLVKKRKATNSNNKNQQSVNKFVEMITF